AGQGFWLARPLDLDDFADEVRSRYGTTQARVAGLCSVVPHEEVLAFRDVLGAVLRVLEPDVGLAQQPPVDVDLAAHLLDRLGREADQPLHELSALAALFHSPGRCLEDDDVGATWVSSAVALDDDGVGDGSAAAGIGSSAVKRS